MSGKAWEEEIAEIRRRQSLAAEMGGAERVQRQKSRGKLTVRERIAALLDPGSFREWGSLAGEGRYDSDGRLTGFRHLRQRLCRFGHFRRWLKWHLRDFRKRCYATVRVKIARENGKVSDINQTIPVDIGAECLDLVELGG